MALQGFSGATAKAVPLNERKDEEQSEDLKKTPLLKALPLQRTQRTMLKKLQRPQKQIQQKRMRGDDHVKDKQVAEGEVGVADDDEEDSSIVNSQDVGDDDGNGEYRLDEDFWLSCGV